MKFVFISFIRNDIEIFSRTNKRYYVNSVVYRELHFNSSAFHFLLDLITDDRTVVCAFDFVQKKYEGFWDHFAKYPSTVLSRVPFAAKIIKNVASQMYMNRVFEHFEDFQIIGFSLGTHIAGVTARLLQNAFGEMVLRIFGKFDYLLFL